MLITIMLIMLMLIMLISVGGARLQSVSCSNPRDCNHQRAIISVIEQRTARSGEAERDDGEWDGDQQREQQEQPMLALPARRARFGQLAQHLPN